MSFLLLSLLSGLVILSFAATEQNTTLLLVQTIFRHGDRAPITLYPTDPNGADVWPNGLGELTQRGKMETYAVGKYLRSMYKDFITSNPNEVYVNSSADERCLNSALSNLAALYAPDEKWKISKDLSWQPIPIHYLPVELDKYLNFRVNCTRRDLALLHQWNSKEIRKFYHTHKTMVKEVSNYSGIDISKPINAFILSGVLLIEKRHDLIIPEWAETYWDDITHLSNEIFQAYFTSPVVLRLGIGSFLEVLTNNLKNKINGKTPDLKFVVNSTHDLILGSILTALNFTNMGRPHYSSTLIIELHEMMDSTMAVRLLYLNPTDPLIDMEKPQILIQEGCSEFCPVEKFIKSYQWLIPDNWTEECKLSDTTKIQW